MITTTRSAGERAGHEGLERDVEAAPEHLAAADQQRVALLVDERVDDRHEQRERQRHRAARASTSRPTPAPAAASADRRPAPPPARAGAGRARPTSASERAEGGGHARRAPSAARSAAAGRRARTSRALQRQLLHPVAGDGHGERVAQPALGEGARARRERGVVEAGHEPDELVRRAAGAPPRAPVPSPGRTVRATSPDSSSSSSRPPSPAKRANTPLRVRALAPARPRRARSWPVGHVATTSRVIFSVPGADRWTTAVGTPAVVEPRRARRGTAAEPASSHSTRTGRRLPSSAVEERLGEGAHDRAAPGRRRPSGGSPTARGRRARARTRPRPRSTPRPFTKKNQSSPPVGAARPSGRRSTARSARRSACPRRTSSAAGASRSGPRAPSAPRAIRAPGGRSRA